MTAQTDNTAGRCKCGCGTPISATAHYVLGHQNKGKTGPLNAMWKGDMPDYSGRTCACGCGETPPLATATNRQRELVKGQPIKWVPGHMSRVRSGKYAKRVIGEKQVNEAGYVQVYRPDHPNAPKNGWVMEHRLVMEEKLGRLLTAVEEVHHDNQQRADNQPDNLILTANSAEHNRLHHSSRNTAWSRAGHACCQQCGTTERRHWANGLCARCHARLYAKNHASS